MYPRLYYFEPPEHSDPDWRMTIYGEILPRAQALLANRSSEEVRFAIETLNYLFGPALSEITREAASFDSFKIPSPAAFLKSKMAKISIVDQAEFVNAQWPEYFACIALALTGRAFETESLVAGEGGKFEKLDPPNLNLAAEPVAAAMEAVVIGESLVDFDEAVGIAAKHRVSLARRSAAISRYARKYELWDELIEFYKERTHLSKANVIDIWFKRLSDEDKKIITKSPKKKDYVVKILRPRLKGIEKN